MALALAIKPLRVAAYCRVSTDTADQLNSQENQVEYFKNAIVEAGHEFAGTYEDEGVSGTSIYKRQDFNRMMYDAGLDLHCANPDKPKNEREYMFILSNRSPKFDYIWCKNIARFARHYMAYDALMKLKLKGVYVRFEGGLTTENELYMTVIHQLLLHAQDESKRKAEAVRFGHEMGARTGKMHTSGKLYGYTYDSKTKTLTVKPEEAEVIRLIFQLYSEGKGIRVILNHLKEQGYLNREGKDFAKSSVARILDNPKYCGTLVRNRWETGRVFVDKHSPRKREGDLIEHEDHEKIDPIITKELFKACQEIREGKVSTQNQKGIYKGHSEYAGLIVCGKCGSSYTKNQDRGRVFYNCSRKKREGVSACDNPNVGLAQIEQFVKFTGLFDFIETVINHRDERCHQLWLKKESILSRKDTDKEQAVAGLVAQVETLERGLKALRGQLLKETISEEEFEETHAEQAQEKQALINQIEELRKDNDQLDAEARAIEAQIERLNQIDPDPTETLRIDQIRNEIKRIIVGRIPEGWFEPVLKVEYKVMDLIDEYANEKAQ